MSKIEWTDETWNPVTGCSKVSEGCRNCYAERLSHRFKWTEKPWNDQNASENVKLHPERLNQPLRWKKSRRIFVNSMSDLFHEQVPFEYIDEVFEIMALCQQHIFQILTKRPERMLDWFNSIRSRRPIPGHGVCTGLSPFCMGEYCETHDGDVGYCGSPWPLPNVWLGVSVENQKEAEERIPLLLQTPAKVRFLSCEPLLGELNLQFYEQFEHPDNEGYGLEVIKGIDWVIVGGESGPRARPMHPDWVRDIRDQCQEAGVSFFFKQWGEWFPRDQWEYNPELVLPDDDIAYTNGPTTHVFKDGFGEYPVHRVGKKKAGRLLDGREWNKMPD